MPPRSFAPCPNDVRVSWTPDGGRAGGPPALMVACLAVGLGVATAMLLLGLGVPAMLAIVSAGAVIALTIVIDDRVADALLSRRAERVRHWRASLGWDVAEDALRDALTGLVLRLDAGSTDVDPADRPRTIDCHAHLLMGPGGRVRAIERLDGAVWCGGVVRHSLGARDLAPLLPRIRAVIGRPAPGPWSAPATLSARIHMVPDDHSAHERLRLMTGACPDPASDIAGTPASPLPRSASG